jgi:hypothetical protein
MHLLRLDANRPIKPMHKQSGKQKQNWFHIAWSTRLLIYSTRLVYSTSCYSRKWCRECHLCSAVQTSRGLIGSDQPWSAPISPDRLRSGLTT